MVQANLKSRKMRSDKKPKSRLLRKSKSDLTRQICQSVHRKNFEIAFSGFWVLTFYQKKASYYIFYILGKKPSYPWLQDHLTSLTTHQLIFSLPKLFSHNTFSFPTKSSFSQNPPKDSIRTARSSPLKLSIPIVIARLPPF